MDRHIHMDHALCGRAAALVAEYSIDTGSLTSANVAKIVGADTPLPAAHARLRSALVCSVKEHAEDAASLNLLIGAASKVTDSKSMTEDPKFTQDVREMVNYFVRINWNLIYRVAELLRHFPVHITVDPVPLMRDVIAEAVEAKTMGLAAMMVAAEVSGQHVVGGWLDFAERVGPSMVCVVARVFSPDLISALVRRKQAILSQQTVKALDHLANSIADLTQHYAFGATDERELVRQVIDFELMQDVFTGVVPASVLLELRACAHVDTVRLAAAEYASKLTNRFPPHEPALQAEALSQLAATLRDDRATLHAMQYARQVAEGLVASNWVAICNIADEIRHEGKVDGGYVRDQLGLDSDTERAA